MRDKLRVAIVGSGPAGMYCVEHLQERFGLGIEIDIYEKLPTPWGLVRYGVAPDHPEKKLIADKLYRYYLGLPQVRFIGNINVGLDISPAEISTWYSAVIYAVGASGDVKLGIPGEDLQGSYSSREFVAWYNGHPDYCNRKFDFSHERAVIIGNGNVALDVARVLTLDTKHLLKTDIAPHALDALKKSRIKEVVILGRRSSVYGAFNNPELEELENLPGVSIDVDFGNCTNVDVTTKDYGTTRKYKMLQRLYKTPISADHKVISLRFLMSPISILGKSKVESIFVCENSERKANGKIQPVATNNTLRIQAGLVFRSIGYRGEPFPGLPFDKNKGVIENEKGRVKCGSSSMQGVYVVGWAKRGPKGVIGTNKLCAAESIDSLMKDYNDGILKMDFLGKKEILKKLAEKSLTLIDKNGWYAIDRYEIQEGRKFGRSRIKLLDRKRMLDLASGHSS